jgi:hypothetical protein
MDLGVAAEGFTRLTYEIKPTSGGVTKLTVTDGLTDARRVASLVAGEVEEDTGAGGGWAWLLSGLKTVVETGASLDR